MIYDTGQRHISHKNKYSKYYCMKHLFRGLIALALILCCTSQALAQQQVPAIPVDQNVRIGKLDNGLTYYIRHNAKPENRAEFYIAQKVGSILEEDNQRGLAHFLEHMCFNGTTHFPGNALREYLENNGVKFGENLNAYTAVDETVYNISNVPVVRDGIIDSCLLILHDWANDLTLDPKEIDEERGVIHEEWRTRQSPMMRMYEKIFPVIYEGSKYAYRLPIGTMEVVDNFPYQDLRDYYEKWYRPDQQGIVVVGDIDVDQIEAKIKKIFSDIEMPANAAKREYFPVPDNDEPIIAIATDKEQPRAQIMVFYKHDPVPTEMKTSMNYMIEDFATYMISSMLNSRLAELAQTPNPPFLGAQVEDGDYFVSKTKDAFAGYAVTKEDAIDTGLAGLLREMERVHRFGFTASEYARAKAEYLRALESAYNERDKQKNGQYVDVYVRNFIDNEPMPGIENEYAMMSQIVPGIPVEAINGMAKELVSDKNMVVAIVGPEKEGLVYPTKEAIRKIIDNSRTEELTAYVDKVSDEPLIAKEPEAGKIVSVDNNGKFGTTIFTLSNGIKVVVKKTDFKADQIMMKGFSFGGNSLFPDSEMINILALNDVATIGGLGNFSLVDLDKVLAGKRASAGTAVSGTTEGISGNCSPKDLETMLQLTYLNFTAPRMDQDAFESYKNRLKAGLKNKEMDPMVTYSDSIKAAIYQHHPRTARMKADMVDKIDYNKIMEMYKDRFKDAGDFTFMFVGNIDIEAAKPLFEKYLASLPSTGRKETFKDNKIDMRRGIYKNEFAKKMETPKASVLAFYNGKLPYTFENDIMMSVLSQVLDIVYTREVREKEGGTYGVGVSGQIMKFPKEEFALQIMFDTDPDKREKMIDIVLAQAQKIAKEGPQAEDLNKVKEFMLKKHKESLKENGFWMGVLNEYYYTGVDMLDGFDAIVNGITPAKIQKFAKQLLDQKNQTEVIMTAAE